MCTKVAALTLLLVGLTSAYWIEYHQQVQQNPKGANLVQNDNQEKIKDAAQETQHEQAALKKIKKAKAVGEGYSAKPNNGYQIQEWKGLDSFKFSPGYTKIKVQKSVPVLFFGYKLIQEEEQEGERKEEVKSDGQPQQQELSPKPIEEPKKPVNEEQPAYDEKDLAEFYKWYKW